MAEHIHWKKAFNPSYIGEWDFPEDGKDMITEITDVTHDMLTGNSGQQEEKTIVHLKGLKPLILNKTNAAALTKVADSPYEDEWVGIKIQLYLERVAAFGTLTKAVRIRDFKPQV